MKVICTARNIQRRLHYARSGRKSAALLIDPSSAATCKGKTQLKERAKLRATTRKKRGRRFASAPSEDWELGKHSVLDSLPELGPWLSHRYGNSPNPPNVSYETSAGVTISRRSLTEQQLHRMTPLRATHEHCRCRCRKLPLPHPPQRKCKCPAARGFRLRRLKCLCTLPLHPAYPH